MSPAYPTFSLLFCPPSPKGKDSPPPALAERSSRREGGDYKFFCRGLCPRRPGIRPLTAPTAPAAVVPRRGACPLGRRLACHRYAQRSGANKAGTLKIHRAADRRQAAGRSSRAEYSEVPGIVGPLSGSDGSFFVILPDRRSSFCGEKRPPGRPGQAPQSHRRWRCRIRTCYPFRR